MFVRSDSCPESSCLVLGVGPPEWLLWSELFNESSSFTANESEVWKTLHHYVIVLTLLHFNFYQYAYIAGVTYNCWTPYRGLYGPAQKIRIKSIFGVKKSAKNPDLPKWNGYANAMYDVLVKKFTFAISPSDELLVSECYHPSVCRLSSVTFVRPTQTTKIFGSVFMQFGTLAISDLWFKILQRSSQVNPSVEG